MIITSFLLSLVIMVLLLMLFIMPFVIVGVAVFFVLRHRSGIVSFFDKLTTAQFSFYRRCWENASKKK